LVNDSCCSHRLKDELAQRWCDRFADAKRERAESLDTSSTTTTVSVTHDDAHEQQCCTVSRSSTVTLSESTTATNSSELESVSLITVTMESATATKVLMSGSSALVESPSLFATSSDEE
jgi:hypothetical protein